MGINVSLQGVVIKLVEEVVINIIIKMVEEVGIKILMMFDFIVHYRTHTFLESDHVLY